MGIFNSIDDTRNFKRFAGWCALIPAAEYQYVNKSTGQTSTWTIHESERGQVEIQVGQRFLDENVERWAYCAPELMKQYAYRLYSLDRKEYDVDPDSMTEPIDVVAMIRLLEDRGVLEFSSVVVPR